MNLVVNIRFFVVIEIFGKVCDYECLEYLGGIE